MNTDSERWQIALESIRYLRHQALTALSDLRQNENRQDPSWRHMWGHWQEELKEMQSCERAARAALAALAEHRQQAA
jgi:hypothetical protein